RFSHRRVLHSFPTRRSSDLALENTGASAISGGPLREPCSPCPPSPPSALRRSYPCRSLRSDHGALRARSSPGKLGLEPLFDVRVDRKSTRLNSSHVKISYAV